MGVRRMLVEDRPGVVVGVLLPDDDRAVVRAGRQEAVAWVGPGDLPDWALVADEDVVLAVSDLSVGTHLEDPDRLVVGSCREAATVVIEFNVML